jgi:hypothetical protein
MQAWQRSDATTQGSISTVGLIGLLGLFAGLCTIFALLATIADAWREHVQQGWPAPTATISALLARSVTSETGDLLARCLRHRICGKRRRNQVEDQLAQHCGGCGDPRRAKHGRGSAMEIHYDPADGKKAVLTTTDMPEAGPRTPNNVRLLLIAFVACVVMLTTARLLSGRAM